MKNRKYFISTIILIILISSLTISGCNNKPKFQEPNKITNNHFGGDFLWYGRYEYRTNKENLDKFTKYTNELGMEIVRFDIYWYLLEPKKGVYNWKLADDLVNTVPGKEIMFTLSSVSQTKTKYQDCIAKFRKIRKGGYYPSSLPNNMDEYLDFLGAIVTRYKDKVKYWQIENEVYGAKKYTKDCPPINGFWAGTSEEYVQLLEASYKKIKSIDPNSVVFASSFAFGTKPPKDPITNENILYTLENGLNYIDSLDLHFYSCVDDDMIKRIKIVKDKMQELGSNKPMWSTETGEIDTRCHTNPVFQKSFDSPEELKLQSEELIKRHAILFKEGIEKIFRLRIFSYIKGEPATSNWNHMGLVHGDQKKPAFYTYQIMVSKLKGFTSAEKLEVGNNVYKFVVNNKPIIIAWSDSGETINLSSYSTKIKITNIITKAGETIPKVETVSSDSIKLSETPIFIEKQ